MTRKIVDSTFPLLVDDPSRMEKPRMATAQVPAIAPDVVLTFEINPGTLPKFLKARAEGGPRLKCFEGSLTLVSPGMSHESGLDRLANVFLAICWELEIEHTPLRSTTWNLPVAIVDTAYEPDAAYYIQSYGRAQENQPPDLAIEIVVSHPATKSLRAAALLGIPELWVHDLPRQKLKFYQLITRGKFKGTYRPAPRSRSFPFLTPADVLELLETPESGALAFLKRCRAWARRVLVPRIEAENGGG